MRERVRYPAPASSIRCLTLTLPTIIHHSCQGCRLPRSRTEAQEKNRMAMSTRASGAEAVMEVTASPRATCRWRRAGGRDSLSRLAQQSFGKNDFRELVRMERNGARGGNSTARGAGGE